MDGDESRPYRCGDGRTETWHSVWLHARSVASDAPPEGLDGATVHVWRASLEQWAGHAEALRSRLSADETARAARFHRERDRLHFTVARGLLRGVLGVYLGLAPEEVRFCYGPHGKPALAGSLDRSRLHFNVAHSGGLLLVAVARDRQIGVDLEQIRPLDDLQEIARHFFSAAEWAALRDLPAAMQRAAFFVCWTRKEAYIKALGEGLSRPLDSFDVSLVPDAPAQLLAVRDSPADVHRWTLRDLDAAAGFAATLAVEGQGWRLRCWHLRPAVATGTAGKGAHRSPL